MVLSHNYGQYFELKSWFGLRYYSPDYLSLQNDLGQLLNCPQRHFFPKVQSHSILDKWNLDWKQVFSLYCYQRNNSPQFLSLSAFDQWELYLDEGLFLGLTYCPNFCFFFLRQLLVLKEWRLLQERLWSLLHRKKDLSFFFVEAFLGLTSSEFLFFYKAILLYTRVSLGK